ncbi:MAG: hypothetical protein ACRDAP_01490, partial [Shewanella sp.]
EQDDTRRRYMLVKAMRAFNEAFVLWYRALATFGIVLDLAYSAVTSWVVTLPSLPTAAARRANGDIDTEMSSPLSLFLPIDLLNWPEMVRFLKPIVGLQINEPLSAAGASPSPLIMRLAFTHNFSEQQDARLSRLVQSFNNEPDEPKRNRIFVKIIYLLKDVVALPADTAPRVAELLGIANRGVLQWLYSTRAPLDTDQEQNAADPESGQQSGARRRARRVATSSSRTAATSTVVRPATTVTSTMQAGVTVPALSQQTSTRRTCAPRATPSLSVSAVATSTAVRPVTATTAVLQTTMSAQVHQAPQIIRPPASLVRSPAPLLTAPPTTATSAVMGSVTTRQAPLFGPMPAVPPVAISIAAVSSAQRGTHSPVFPVFTTPAPSSVSTTQLAPVVPPFNAPDPSLEGLFEPAFVQSLTEGSLDIDMDLEEMLEFFDF